LVDAVGPEGLVVGVEQSADMIEQARDRVQEAGWKNVRLIEAAVEEADLDVSFDAVLFVYTQDVLQSQPALRRIFEATRPGARVACAGLKLFPWYLSVANVWLLAISYPYFTTFHGLRKPWAPLETFLDDVQIRSTFLGSGYIANGQRRHIANGQRC
jgi:ubiquinone/menaquinone biosynthesis C-methylase UbiE